MTTPELGVGEILETQPNGFLTVYFEFAGIKRFKANFLRIVVGDEALSPRLDNFSRKGGRSRAETVPSPEFLKKKFLSRYKAGFLDPLYLEEERDYKDKAAKLMAEKLNANDTKRLIQEGKPEDVASRAIEVLKATNLVHPVHEVLRATDKLKNPQTAGIFGVALDALLFGNGPFSDRFQRFVKELPFESGRWPLSTYFPFLAFPAEHVFVRPTDIQNVSKALQFEIHYHSEPNWKTYSAILRLMDCVRQEIADLKPKDMIDVQSFIWFTTKEY